MATEHRFDAEIASDIKTWRRVIEQNEQHDPHKQVMQTQML